jgi:hypothetical protein
VVKEKTKEVFPNIVCIKIIWILDAKNALKNILK